MSLEENKKLVRRLIDEYHNQRNTETADEIIAADYVAHDSSGKDWSLDNSKGFIGGVIPTSFPDMKDTILHLLAEGDLVVSRVNRTATFTGDMGELPATNKKASFEIWTIWRIASGKIAESCDLVESMPLQKALGTYGKE